MLKKGTVIAMIMFGSFIKNATCQEFYNINTINTIEITFQESNWDQLLDDLVAAGNEERLNR
jgi:hypothetical protein